MNDALMTQESISLVPWTYNLNNIEVNLMVKFSIISFIVTALINLNNIEVNLMVKFSIISFIAAAANARY